MSTSKQATSGSRAITLRHFGGAPKCRTELGGFGFQFDRGALQSPQSKLLLAATSSKMPLAHNLLLRGRQSSRSPCASVPTAFRIATGGSSKAQSLETKEYGTKGYLMKALIAAFLIATLTVASVAQDLGWPREKSNAGSKLIYYQPQLDEWKDFRQLEARMAVSLTPAGGQPTVGVIYLRARTDADLDARNVVISRLEITGTRFPSLDDAGAAKMDQLVRTFLPPTSTMSISLDRLLAGLEIANPASPSPVVVKNDPPRIFVNYGSAILLLVDGEPVRAPIEKTKLEFVVNTNWDLFFDKSTSQYYLLNVNQWLTAASLEGPWKVTATLPKDMSKLPDQTNWADVKKAIPPPAATSTAVPKVFYSNTPAEIITFKGQPKYAKIPATQLVYATNTDSDLFVQPAENQYYYLVSGRWFRAKSLDGPWSYATADLPADFARIPLNSERSRVLASVPGTDEAKDAVLLAQVPTTVIVDRAKAEAEVKVSYDGDPQFQPIESTSLSYASNTQDKIIKVGDLYYLCFQGVWFMSTSPQGPWKTADSVPKEIYTIPASSPVYNVTYVTQTTTSSGEVESSSTAGYLGMFIIGVAVGATLAYGSGYYYPPYYYRGPYGYPIYRPYPITYGVGAFYNPHNGAYGYARGAYGPYGGVAGAVGYNPGTGTYARAAGACGAYGCAGGARAYNPYTGARGATRQGSNAYSQWGSSVVTKGDKWAQTGHYSDSRGTVAGGRTSEGGRVVAGSGQNGRGYVGQSGNGDVYAGKDGNVYKKTDGGWQQYQNGGWSPADTSGAKANIQQQAQSAGTRSATQSTTSLASTRQSTTSRTQPTATQTSQRPVSVSQDTVSGLNREASARQTGTQRTQQYNSQRTRSTSSGRTRRARP
jgi:hypothetical protein